VSSTFSCRAGRQFYACRTFIFAKNLGVYGPFYLSTFFPRVYGGGCASTSFSYSCSCSLSPRPSATCTYHHLTAPINTSRFRRATVTGNLGSALINLSTYPLIHPVNYWSLLPPGTAFRRPKKLRLISGNYGELQCQLRLGNYSTTFGVPIDRGCAFSVPSVENRRHSRTSNQTQSHLKKLGATTPLGAGTLLDGRATTPLGAAKVCLYLHRRLTSIREFTVAPVYSRGANPEVLFTPVCSCSSLSKTGVNRTKLDLTGVIRTKSAISAQRSCFIPHRQSSNSEVLGIIPKVVTTPARNNCELLGIKISGIAKIPGYSDLFRLIPSKTAISPTLVRTH
jgi:hypothetical protein